MSTIQINILVYLKVIFDRVEKMVCLKEQCPPEGTQHTHISLFLMRGEGGVLEVEFGITRQ